MVKTLGRIIQSIALGFLVLLLAFAGSHATASATPPVLLQGLTNTVYYVSSTGDDSNPGTSSQPFRSIQRAANATLPGDRVIVLAGIYWERVYVTQSGSPGYPITFTASGTVSMRGFSIQANFIMVIGFDISNTPDDNIDGIGIAVKGTDCLIENNYIHFATRGGILLYTSPGSFSETSNCIIRNNRLYRNAMNGLDVNGRNHFVEGNEVWGTIQYHPNWHNPPAWVDADGMHFHGAGHIFRNNYIHDIHYGIPENVNPHIDCFQTFGGDPYSETARDVIFEQNTCINTDAQSPGEVGQGFMITGASNLTFRNNVVQAYRHFDLVGSTNLSIVNNVLTGLLSSTDIFNPSVVSMTGSPNITFKNNAVYNPRGHIIYPEDSISKQGLDVGYNSAYRSDGKALWDPPYPHDLWGVNPLFVNPGLGDFRLQPNSPLIDAGTPRADVPSDFYGTPRPQGSAPDIGIYEYPFPQKLSIPPFGRMDDTITFAITFLPNGNPVTMTDGLPAQFTYVSSSTSCGGMVGYDPGTRQVTFSGVPPAGNFCAIHISTKINTSQTLAVTNTASVTNAPLPLQVTSVTVILNGLFNYLPFIIKTR